ncbi:hypothetical protein KA093_03075 [Candidatus Saccharibacteria bacterium]|nr:hypothetical protein [Candidatus Saccharibacteria bacterium]
MVDFSDCDRLCGKNSCQLRPLIAGVVAEADCLVPVELDRSGPFLDALCVVSGALKGACRKYADAHSATGVMGEAEAALGNSIDNT